MRAGSGEILTSQTSRYGQASGAARIFRDQFKYGDVWCVQLDRELIVSALATIARIELIELDARARP